MTKVNPLTIDEIKAIYDSYRDDDELSVGYERTYDTVLDWLIRPVGEKGVGINIEYAALLMSSVATKIKNKEISFATGKELDLYLKARGLQYMNRARTQGMEVNRRLALDEINKIDSKKVDALVRFKKTIRKLQWLSIIMGLSLTVTMVVLLLQHKHWLISLVRGVF
ncbi:MAG: hypothetical protein SVO01_00495 [Thermotogota bacterium]|nr:hypothetical protein [Thermotogota bacterium]